MTTATETEKPTESDSTRKASSKTAWKQAKVFKGITLPSGAVVDIELPDLPQLAKAGQIPDTLLADVAELQEQIAGEGKAARSAADRVQTLVNIAGFSEFILPRMLVSPKIDEADVGELPAADKEMLLQFAARARDIDAVGHHLAGLEKLDSFRRFREFDFTSAALGG